MDVVLSLRAASVAASMCFSDDEIETAAAGLASVGRHLSCHYSTFSVRRPRKRTPLRSSIGRHNTLDEHDLNHCRQSCRPGFLSPARTRCSQTELNTSEIVIVVWNPVTQQPAFFVALCQIIGSITAPLNFC